jgi:hypothetical protein
LDTLWSQNTSRQSKNTTNDQSLQSRRAQITGTIHKQPQRRSENPWVLGSIPGGPSFSVHPARFSNNPCPRRAGRSPGWPPPAPSPVGEVVGCGIPPTSPRATTRRPGGTRGQHEWRKAGMVPPRRRVVGLTPGRRDATRRPTCKIINGCRAPEASRWWTDQDQAVSRP